jgi:D-alanyl-D-alanine carboxypeptidase (penicillin-binding protein 5/6)
MEAVASGETALDEIMIVPADAAASAMPPDSSLMFLDTGQQVTVEELLLGLVVSSGNDAAVAVGLHIAGSVEAFVRRMNDSVRALGLTRTSFADISGLSPENATTAREFAQFLSYHLTRFPELRPRLYSQVEFAYPKPHNLAAGTGNRPIVQRNRNLLVGTDPRVNGLKTGFIEESGYNIAVSAREESLDFVAVVLGVDAPNHSVGGRLRAEAAKQLIDFGFQEFRAVALQLPPIEPVEIWEGTVEEIVPVGAPSEILVPTALLESLTGRVFQEQEATAPVARGAVLGSVVYFLGDTRYHEVDLVAPRIVDAAGPLQRLWDRLLRRLRTNR